MLFRSAEEAAGALEAFRATEAELLSYYDEFAEEPLARAGAAMLDGLEYLKHSCRALSSDDERLLMFVG